MSYPRPDRPRRRQRPVDQLGIQRAASPPWVSGCRSTSTSVTNATITDHSERDRGRGAGPPHQVSTVNGTSTLQFGEAGKPLTVALPTGRDAVGADHRRGHRRRFSRRPVRYHGLQRHPVRRVRFRASRYPAPPCWCPARRLIPLSHNGIWESELLGRSGCAWARLASSARRRWPLPRGAGEPEPHLTVPEPIAVTPTVWVRARQGSQPGRPYRAPGAALPSATPPTRSTYWARSYAAADGDPAPRGPRHRASHSTRPRPPSREVARPQRCCGPASDAEFLGTRAPDDGGDRPGRRAPGSPARRRPRPAEAGAAIPRHRHRHAVDLDWDDVIDRTAPFRPAEATRPRRVEVARRSWGPIAAADATRNRDPGDLPALRPRPGNRGGGPVRADRRRHHRRRAARRRPDPRQSVPVRADRIALRPAGAADQPRRGVRRRRYSTGRSPEEPITHGYNGSRRNRRMDTRSP